MKLFLDLDGTLVDSTQRHVTALKDVLNEEGIEANIDNYIPYKRDGFSTKQYLINILGLSTTQSISVSKKWTKIIEDEKYLLLDRLYDDSNDFLDWSVAQGFCIDILTARRNEESLYQFLKNSCIDKKIDQIFVVSPSNAGEEKNHILHLYSHKKNIFIGDTEADFDACEDTDIQLFVLNRGFRSERFWNSKGIKSYYDLQEIKEAMVKKMSTGGKKN